MRIEDEIKQIKEVLVNGGIVAVPTDTVYGLICDATNEKAVKKLYQLKRRDLAKPIGIFVKDKLSISSIVDLNKVSDNVLDIYDYSEYNFGLGRLKKIKKNLGNTIEFSLRLKPFESLFIVLPKIYEEY